MENKNALILGLIKRVIEYGDISTDISLQSLENIFGNQTVVQAEVRADFDEVEFLRHQLDSQMMMTQMLSEQLIRQERIAVQSQAKPAEELPFYQYIYSKLCTEESVLKEMFADISLARLSEKCKYSKIVCATRKMGMTLLCTASYKEAAIGLDGSPPSIVMGAFVRMSIDRIFDTENDKYRYKPDAFRQKMNELFSEANKANYNLAICAVEPFGAKMFFYTNDIPLYYTSNEQLIVLPNVDKRLFTQLNSTGYREFSIDYAKNSIFYLPTFSMAEENQLEDLDAKLKKLIQGIHRQGIGRQKQEIQSLFTDLPEKQAEILAGDSILIFKI